MAGVLKIEIVEHEDSLQQMLDQESDSVRQTKLQILLWIKRTQAIQVNEIAARSGHHRTTISRWLSSYRKGGLTQLLARPKPGRIPQISKALREKIRQELAKPARFKTYREIEAWLLEAHGLEIPYQSVYRTVRNDLKFEVNPTQSMASKAENFTSIQATPSSTDQVSTSGNVTNTQQTDCHW